MLGGATAIAAKKIGKNQIKANAITTGKIKRNAVTTAKIKGAAVTTGKLANGAVTTDKLADNAVTGAKVAEGSLTGSDIDQATLTNIPSVRIGSARLGANQTKSVSLGNWTFSETANGAGACQAPQITAGSKDGSFTQQQNGVQTAIAAGASAALLFNPIVNAATNDGTGFVQAVVDAYNQGGACVFGVVIVGN